MGFVAMHSPYDPKPSVKVENGIITELDGKSREKFDFIDQFIADYAIRIDRTEKSMAIPSLDIARKIVDINVTRKEILKIEEDIPMERILEVRRDAKRKVFVRNSLRVLKTVAPNHDLTQIPNVVLVGGSAENFEIPEMLESCAEGVYNDSK